MSTPYFPPSQQSPASHVNDNCILPVTKDPNLSHPTLSLCLISIFKLSKRKLKFLIELLLPFHYNLSFTKTVLIPSQSYFVHKICYKHGENKGQNLMKLTNLGRWLSGTGCFLFCKNKDLSLPRTGFREGFCPTEVEIHRTRYPMFSPALCIIYFAECSFIHMCVHTAPTSHTHTYI